MKITLSVAGVTTQVQVSADAPVVDTKKMTTSTNVSVEELQNIPSSRDPWVVLQTVPGVIVDRVNVGGAESGQQSNYQAKGAPRRRQHVEHRRHRDHRHGGDGLDADLLRLRHVPGDAGHDRRRGRLERRRGGVQLNMVLKSGSNTPHGSTRIYFENEDMQSNNMPADLAASIGGTTRQGQPHGRVQGLRLRDRRADREEPVLGLGRHAARPT